MEAAGPGTVAIAIAAPLKDGATTGFVLESADAGRSQIRLTLFTRETKYVVSTPVAFSTPLTVPNSTGAGGYRSEPLYIALPGTGRVEDACVEVDGASDSESCLSVAHPGHPAHEAPVWKNERAALQEELTGGVSGQTVSAASGEAIAPPACRVPYAAPEVRWTDQRPAYPGNGLLADTAVVAVSVDAKGTLSDARLVTSSGSTAFDESTLQAARQAAYRPEIFRCEAVASRRFVWGELVATPRENGVSLANRLVFEAEPPPPRGSDGATLLGAVAANADETIWGFVLSRGHSETASVTIVLLSATTSYTATFASVAFSNPDGNAYAPRFITGPLFVAVPAGAHIQFFCKGTGNAQTDSSTCSDLRRRPDVPPVRKADDALRAHMTGSPPAAPEAAVAAPAPIECKNPYVDAHVIGTNVAPDVPYGERMRLSGTTGVKVTLDATGAVSDTRIYASSGSEILDRASLDAAWSQRFAPRIFRCAPIASAYLIRYSFGAPR